MDKQNLKLCVRIFIKTLVMIAMVAIINVSTIAIAVAVEKPVAGYTVYYSEDGGKTLNEVYTYYYADGEDTKYDNYKDDNHYYKKNIAGKISDGAKNGINIFCAVASILLMLAVFYTDLWAKGDKDATRFELSGAKYKKTQGLIDALLGTSPFILSFLILIAAKIFNVLPFFNKIYFYINYYLFPFLEPLLVKESLNEISFIYILIAGIVLIPIPLICAIAYYLGSKHLNIKNKLMYKKEDTKNG